MHDLHNHQQSKWIYVEFYLNKGHFAPVETTLFSITTFKHHLLPLLSFTQQSPTLLRTTVIFVEFPPFLTQSRWSLHRCGL